MTDIVQLNYPSGDHFYPKTHAQAIEGLSEEISGQINYPVTSVNGKNGDVRLTAADIGAATPGDIPDVTVTSVNDKTGAVNLSAGDVGAYSRNETDNLLENKVDKIEGKQLSTEDYTTEEKDQVTKIVDKQDRVLVSPNGSKFILSVADDGTLNAEPYVEGSEA
ncbi:hypothetical protein [Sporolactobacillus terrae]|uniref:hypothetical protein n=1 Tax=Sporolactobacillus terrae TaxID=269673 RepID=UPI00048E401E|nr:hypothetical protein [Sporolactobacillus terrae]